MKLDLSQLTLTHVLSFVAFVGAIAFVSEALFSPPLVETVTVSRHTFAPDHTIYTGRSVLHYNDSWTLGVFNQNGYATVEVSPVLYKQVKDGDKVTVKGAKGLITRHWYIYGAEIPK